jgi:hypothetical protein
MTTRMLVTFWAFGFITFIGLCCCVVDIINWAKNRAGREGRD